MKKNNILCFYIGGRMSLKKMSKDELELMSNKDITYLLLEESAKPINTLNLFKKIAIYPIE